MLNTHMTNLAPVVLFTYKRLEITKKVIGSLLENKECLETDLIVYSDGPKKDSDKEEVEKVRQYLKSLCGFKSIKFIYREKNLGLAQSFIQGITETFVEHEKAIFLEDDNLLSKGFLSFMNRALDKYEHNEKVICVTGYSWPLWPKLNQPYFIRGAETWSMGTWRRGWKHFCADGKKLLSDIQDNKLIKKFNYDGFGFYKMLQRQVGGEIDSWGVRWSASAFVNNMYCLHPHKALCVSIGYGGDSVHCNTYSPLFRSPSDLVTDLNVNLPEKVGESITAKRRIKFMNKFFYIRSFFLAVYNKINIFLKR